MKERNVWLIFDVWLRSYSVFQGWSLLISFSLKWKKKVLFTHSPYTVNPPHQLYQFISMTSAQKNSHTQKHSCAVTHTATRVLSHTSLDKTLFIWLFHFKTIWFTTPMTNCFSALHMTECLHSIYEWLCGCACICAEMITLTCQWLHTCLSWHSQKPPWCLFPLHANQLVGRPPKSLACSPGMNAGKVGRASGENSLKPAKETNTENKTLKQHKKMKHS